MQSIRASAFSDSIGQEGLYGALMDQEAAHAAKVERSNKRKRFNSVPLVISLLVPWVVFMTSFGLAAYEVRYKFPMTILLVEVAVLAAFFLNLLRAWRERSELMQDGFYPLYLAVMLFLASSSGLACGEYTYSHMSYSAMRVSALAAYTNVDPSVTVLQDGQVSPTRGARYQDLGMVRFPKGTIVDTSRSRSYRNGILYCVAPIVNPLCKTNCGMDFWAVGINCCSEYNATDFTCGGEISDKDSAGGLREVNDAYRPFYRLAVLQSPQASQALSPHPLFFEWTASPELLASERRRDSFRNFILLMFLSFATGGFILFMSLKWAPMLWPFIPGKI